VTAHATGKFKVESWDEETYTEIDAGGKLTRASVKQAFSGGIAGEGAVEWLMCYRPDKTADFVGLQRVVGQLGDRSGTFVLQTTGSFDGKEAKGEWSVLAGSGTDALAGLRGSGGFSAPLGGEASVTLDYDFE
jgi:Protein of unknown function (DUF3224)